MTHQDIQIGSLWSKKSTKGRTIVKVYNIIQDGHNHAIVAYKLMDGSSRAGMSSTSHFLSDYEPTPEKSYTNSQKTTETNAKLEKTW